MAGYQVIDDISYTRGRNTLRGGYNIRRDNITDIQGIETTNPVSVTYEEDFLSGITDVEYVQRFPQRATQPVSVYNEGGYIEDQYKVAPTLRSPRDSGWRPTPIRPATPTAFQR